MDRECARAALPRDELSESLINALITAMSQDVFTFPLRESKDPQFRQSPASTWLTQRLPNQLLMARFSPLLLGHGYGAGFQRCRWGSDRTLEPQVRPVAEASLFESYRRDHFGYASVALGRVGPGPNTLGLACHATPIHGADLRPGDLLINKLRTGAGHAVIFDHWTIGALTHCVAYEQSGNGDSHHRVCPTLGLSTEPVPSDPLRAWAPLARRPDVRTSRDKRGFSRRARGPRPQYQAHASRIACLVT